MDAGLQAGARGWVPGAVAECRGLSARGRVLMAGAEALAGAQWRVRIPGAECCQKVLDRTMRLVKDFDYLCSPSSEGVSAP